MSAPSDINVVSPNIRVGVRGLPNLTDGMISGGLYVFVTETPPARFPILATTLNHALAAGSTCTVVVAADPPSFIQRIESFGTTGAAAMLSSNQLRFFTMQSEFSKKMFQFGAESFVQELENFAVPPCSYLLFDQADELLSLHDFTLANDQIEILRNWCASRQITLLLVFLRAGEGQISTLNGLMDSMKGMARLAANKGSLELAFDYWQSPEGTVAARNFQLQTLDSGLYEATASTTPQEATTDSTRADEWVDAGDQELDFFYLDPDLGSLAKQMSGNWCRVDTLVGMMHATRNMRAAACILTYQRDTHLRQLAETVHTLRLSMGKHAKIVVQEKQASLRYQNEALLLSLGVNLVVNRDVPASRLPLILDSLVGQIFARDVDINFEAALASVLPTQLRGYLPPLRFLREVSAILTRGETLNIPCALIKGRPRQDVAMTRILASGGLSRPGDLVTADREFCYLFLNACPQPAMLVTLDRILGGSADTSFEEVSFQIRREEIQAVLDALAHEAARSELPDYSSLMPPTLTTDTATLPTQSTKSVSSNVSSSSGNAALPADESRPLAEPVGKEPNDAPNVPDSIAPLLPKRPEQRVFSYNSASAPTPVGRGTGLRAKRSQFAAGSPSSAPNKPIH